MNNNIFVYNTLTRKKEQFAPEQEGKVRMYICGPTTYNYIHLGNARPIVVFDTIRRFFEFSGYEVTYIQNFTDVDDKIINKAKENNEEPTKLAARFIEEYFKDADKLNVKRATEHPKVSEHMDEIINFVQGLIEKGFAYEVDGDVYFAVRKFEEYGKLSGRSVDDLRSGARIEVDERKHDPLDFALWKNVKPGEPSWKTPWGEGRPGWHIECSAMSNKYLGEKFDIHAGGQDLIFPHHENEIAQTECFSGKPMSKYWLHNGFITINQEKMSKSLGNFFLLREIVDKFPPMVVRFYLLSTHYRSPLDFDDEKLQVAQKSLERIENAYNQLSYGITVGTNVNNGDNLKIALKDTKDRFIKAMNDDFNTSLALATLFDLSRDVNTYLKEQDLNKEVLVEAKAVYDELLTILGINFTKEEAKEGLADDLMELIISIRKDARANKDFNTADKIRDGLKEIGISLEDTAQGTKWKKS
ncbi:cysteinyl-tRNA synthetase [Desulfonispora thiosulfatigenes DSM 11270]|uniref:Cysteine--tRNA ligase n=1 Tax=Desulfonispora thiosulfatigenes DSM 11270 TaxID=656914 RepID=A0A1W1UTW3_DESTI|nr:cysteine--tRNA ligase [Desulfonispora thiosulfatigenes]SMB84429.1 cysteinyl-tRNA synthetase [Desulfonispora thiosulfatigenes DSM 11270]